MQVRFLPPQLERKGMPIGDGSCLENSRAMSLEGSTPSPSAFEDDPRFRGRLMAGLRALNPPVLVRLQPPELDCPGGETEIMAPSEGAGPGSIPGRGTDDHPRGVADARNPAKVEDEVRLLTGILTTTASMM